ncbi:hypothetical protein TL16_g03554 [Triparma laevis f. inornata]|uniref:Nucleoside-diphosphate kinase n=1 Tax=Triparma laevis f. inornata TaxID=1714386 RepID=A0A9W6ZYN5_9STRA|nr:hypothetical protein TL16_g03554 [Triparma laevis f. inornata]
MGNGALTPPEDLNDDLKDRSNIALIFIKPHCSGIEKVRNFVKSQIEAKGLTILAEKGMSAEDIEEMGCIDKHYASIAKSAMVTLPGDISPPDDKKEAFKAAFGSTWEEALELGLIHNAKGACEKLGSMDGDNLVPLDGGALDKKWAGAEKKVKLGPGLYVGNIGDDEPLYVINGFYMAMREKYVTGDGIYYYVVGFDSEQISWAKFRGEIIGATNPEEAPEGSIRGQMLANWEGTDEEDSAGLDMDDKPDVGNNGVHASAGPIEGLKERTVWLGYEAIDDPFGEQLIAWTGGKAATIAPWLEDAEVEEAKNYGIKGKMFDLTEDKDTPWAIQFCNNLALA